MNNIQLLFAVTVLPQLYLKINIFIEPRKQERERERERERKIKEMYIKVVGW
jgi:hypothetical protein